MATTQNSTTALAPHLTPPYELLTIWLPDEEAVVLRAEQERRNAEREKHAALIHQVWPPLTLAETAELMISELLRERSKARKEGGAQ